MTSFYSTEARDKALSLEDRSDILDHQSIVYKSTYMYKGIWLLMVAAMNIHG